MSRLALLFLAMLGILTSANAAVAPPRQIYFQYENTVWWGTEFGLNRFQSENELWANIRPEPVNDLCLDEKTVWVGTDHGIYYADLRYLDWKGYTAKQGLPSDTVVRSVADLDFVYAAGPHGLARFNKLVEQWEPLGNFSDKRIYDLYSNQTQLWVATDSGVLYFDKKFEKWESYSASTGLISNTVFRLFYFNDYIWTLTDKGFSRYSASMKTWNSYPLGDGVLGSSVNYILTDASYIWVISPEGISRFNAKNQAWENFSKNMPIEKSAITSISTTGNTSWFTTANGVYSFDEDQRRWKTYTAVDGLSDDAQDIVFTSGQTTLCKKGNTFSYLRPTDDLWYTSEIKSSAGSRGVKPSWKTHMDETGFGVAAPNGQNVNLLGRAYTNINQQADFPAPVLKNIGNYLTNKNLDSVAIITKTDSNGTAYSYPDTIARYKDFLYGWTKAQLNLNADLNNGRTFRGTYDNTDPLGDKRYSMEYRGFGDDNLRRLGWRTDQKTDYFFSSLISPVYLEGAGLRTEFGDRVGEKKIRRVNTGVWAGWGKTSFFRQLIPFREDNFYQLGIENIITESVVITVDGTVIDPSGYSIERTVGLLTFKDESLANPDSRIEVSCQYQPKIGQYTNDMASVENTVSLNDKIQVGVNGMYRGIQQPNLTGNGNDTNRAFAGSVNSKFEFKSPDGKLYLRAIPELSSSYNDSILALKEGTAAKLSVFSVAHNLKFKGSILCQTPDYVSLADQYSVYGRINQQADGEFVYDAWQQYMPITIGASTIDASYGKENRQYAQYLVSPVNIPSLRLYVMHEGMTNERHSMNTDSLSRDSLSTQRLNGIVETQWDLPDSKKTILLEKLWIDASYSANMMTDSVYDTTHTASYDQRFNQYLFTWLRWSPVKKLQLESKNIARFFSERDSTGNPFTFRGKRLYPELKLFSQELIPGLTLYGDYVYQYSENIDSFQTDTKSTINNLISSVLLVPGIYVPVLNPFQLNIGYNISSSDSLNGNTKINDINTHMTSVKPILDFSQDLHCDSRTEISETRTLSLLTEKDLKIYNDARLAFWERKTRLDVNFNVFSTHTHNPNYMTLTDTSVYDALSSELIFKWTQRWFPNFRTEQTIDFSRGDYDTTVGNNRRSTGNVNTTEPGILFDFRNQGNVLRETRIQYYTGVSFSNDSIISTYEVAQVNKLDVQIKAGSNFFLRLLLDVSYLINQKVLKYDLAELKVTALF